jgi:hypothetical protein
MRLGDIQRYRYMLRLVFQKLLFKLRVALHNLFRK